MLAADVAVVDRLDRAALIFLHAAARLHPFDAGARQTLFHVDRHVRVGIDAGGVVHGQRRLAARCVERDLAHRHAQLGRRIRRAIDLARSGQRSGGDLRGHEIGGCDGFIHGGLLQKTAEIRMQFGGGAPAELHPDLRCFLQETAMNKAVTSADLVTPKVTTGSLPASRKVYCAPDAAPELRVPVREIALDASSGEPPLPVYDTTGVYSDPDVAIDVEKGLARTRIEWVKARGGVEEYQGRPIQPVDNGNVSGKHLARNFPNTPKPWRAVSPSPLWGGSLAEGERGGG